MPWASTPTSRRVPWGDATADPSSVKISCVADPDAGACLCSG